MKNNDFYVGVIGLGNAGKPILNNLYRTSKYQLIAFDTDATKFADIPSDIEVAQSVSEVAQRCMIVITCLPKPEHVLSVIEGEDGLLANCLPNAIWIDTSTTNFKQTQELASKALENNINMLEATLTGGVHALQKNNMVCLAGGDADTFSKWKHVLQDAIGPVVIRCGDTGAGAIAKVVSNMLAFTNMVAAAECLMLAKRAGLNIESFFDAIRSSAGNSFAWETVVPHIFNQKYEAGFTMDLACKDMHLCYLMGRNLEVPLELHGLVEQMMNRARLQYGDSEGCYVFPRTLEDVTGESLAVTGWEEWGYDLAFCDGSIVVNHKNRPTTDCPQHDSQKTPATA